MDRVISTSAQTTLTNTSTADTNAHNYYIARWVSPQLNQTSVAANTWTVEIGIIEENANANFPRSGTGANRVNCYVWKPSNGTKYGTILDGNTNTDAEEAGTTQTASTFTFSGSAVSSLTAGDAVIVFEMWAIVTQGMGTAYTQTIAYDGTTEGSTTNEAAFLSTPENLLFAFSTSISESSISASETLDRTLGASRSISESSISDTETLGRTLGASRTLSESSITSGDTLTRVYNAFRTLSESAISVADAVVRACTLSRKAGTGFSLTLDGTGDDIDLGAHTGLWSKTLQAFSFSIWVKIGLIDANFRTIFSVSNGTNEVYLTTLDDEATVELGITNYAPAYTHGAFLDTDVPTLNRWVHYSARCDNIVTGEIHLYVDAVEVDSGFFYQDEDIPIGATTHLFIGSYLADLFLKGHAKDFRWWNSYIADSDIAKVMNNDPSAPTPDYWLKMREGTSTPVDSIGSKTTSFGGDTTWSNECPDPLIYDDISSTDSASRVIGYPRTINESTISSTDALTAAQVLSRTISEIATTVSDQLDRIYNAFRTNSESSISSTDSVARTIGYPRDLNESAISVSDQLDRRLDFFRDLVESAISSTDSAVRSVTNSRTLSEASIAVSDALTRLYDAFRTNPESVTSGDQLDRSVTNSRAINESSISSTDQADRIYGANRPLNESSISSGDTLTRSQVLSRTLTEAAITVSDQLDRMLEFFRTISESAISSGDSVARAVTNNRTLSEAGIAVSDLLERLYNAFRNIDEDVDVDDSVAADVTSQGNFNRNLDETVTSGDSVDRAVTNNRSLPESVSSGDSVDRRIDFFRIISEAAISVNDSVNRALVFTRALADIVVSTDSVQRIFNAFRTNPETVTSGDSVTRSTSDTRSLPESTTVNDNLARSVSNSRPLNENVVSGDSVSRSLAFFRNLADTIGVTDFVERAAQMTRQLIDSVLASDLVSIFIKRQEDVTNTDLTIIITNWLAENWTDDPLSTVEHYLIPPKSKVTFGSRFDMSAGTHSDTHVHVRNVSKNITSLSTDATVEENSAIVSIWVEVRYIPDTPPDFSGDTAGAPSDMMWQIRSYIDELIRSDPEQLSNKGIEVISIMQEIPDANTPADVHAQNVIENMYTIVIMVKCFYTLKIDRQV